MSKRKISCSTCRTKKIKCDGNKPCERCRSKGIECIYTKPGQAGRPPKNAVMNKFLLARPSNNFCREFIFENTSVVTTRYLKDSKSYGLGFYLNNLFTTFVPVLIKSHQLVSKKRQRRSANGQINDLSHYFSWMSADVSALLIQRVSKLRLTHYFCTELLAIIILSDPSPAFFDSPKHSVVLNNPLNSIPPDQALRLIECFFSIHPYSFIINKTMLLQSYWTDTTDPLLLSVLYGVTLFLSHVINGQPLDLWDTDNLEKRNPFLEYAHVLLSKASSEVTVSRYQAVVLLAVFEVTFGYAKKGMSLFALSYMIAEQLGLFNSTLPEGMSPIERESLLVTFWGVVQCTARGCLELASIPRKVICYQSFKYPPVNASSSLSYQFDLQKGNPKLSSHYNYLVETFYVESVLSKLVCKILPVLDLDTVEQEIDDILVEFSSFVQQEKHTFSDLQLFTFELYYALYSVCLRFLRKTKNGAHLLPGGRTPKELDLADSNNIQTIYEVFPDVVAIVDKILCFVHSHPSYDPNFLPRAAMTSVIDAMTKVLIYHYTLEPSPLALQCLETLEIILSHATVWENWESVDTLKPTIREFLQKHTNVSAMDEAILMPFNWLDPTSLFLNNSLTQIPNLYTPPEWGLPATDFDLLGVNFMQ